VQKDNQTLPFKIADRKALLSSMDEAPVVMETHGGAGGIFLSCYREVEQGIAFEKDPAKAAVLAQQRPAWAIYEADCVASLAGGAGGHLLVNVLDVDPYGECWPVLAAFFGSERPRSERLYVAVNDGLRQKIKTGAWAVKSMSSMVRKYGNALCGLYLQVCEELLAHHAKIAGYEIKRFYGYYCGASKGMTHFVAHLQMVRPSTGLNVLQAKPTRRDRKGNAHRAYLDSPVWAKKKEERLLLAQYRCDDCGAVNGLQVHHETYERYPGQELMDDLAVVCPGCHAKRHDDDPGLKPPYSPEYL